MHRKRLPETLDNGTSALVLSQFKRHFRCSHADHIASPSTDSGLGMQPDLDVGVHDGHPRYLRPGRVGCSDMPVDCFALSETIACTSAGPKGPLQPRPCHSLHQPPVVGGLAAYWQRSPRSGQKTRSDLRRSLVRDTGIEPVGAWAQPRALHGQINDFSSATKLSDRCANIGVSLGRLGSMDHYPRRKP